MSPSIHVDGTECSLPTAEVQAELDRILASEAFRRVERPARFLRHLVATTLRGEGHLLKESLLGVEVFDRSPSWDPRLEPVVRQEAARLRKRLARYYENEAPDAPVRIEVPVGAYVPVFVKRALPLEAPRQLQDPPSEPAPVRRNFAWARSKWAVVGGILVLLVAGVGVWVKVKPQPRLSQPKTEAEELYLEGVYHWQKRTPESLRHALDLFTQAIVRDPGYALAYVGLADCYNLLREFAAMPESEAYPRALAATRKALELDDRSAEAHTSLAFISFWWNWNAALAEREYQRAIDLDPKYATAHHWYATFLLTRLRQDEALEQIGIAQKLDPASTSILADKGLILYLDGKKEEALSLLQQLEAENALPSTHRYLARIFLRERDYARYVEELNHIAARSQDEASGMLARAASNGFAAGGGKAMLEQMLNIQVELHERGLLGSYTLAESYARVGRNREALQFLEDASNVRGSAFMDYRGNEAFDGVRSDPRFQRLDARIEPQVAAGTLPEAP